LLFSLLHFLKLSNILNQTILLRRLSQIDEKTTEPLKWPTFLRIFKHKDLSLFNSKNDRCDTCALDSQHVDPGDRLEVDKDKTGLEPSTYVFSAAVQNALPVPQIAVSACYFCPKLNCTNFTLYDMKNRSLDCYFWSEDEGGFEPDTFITCILDHLMSVITNNASINHIIMYSKPCDRLNHNDKVSNALLHFAVTNGVLVEQKFSNQLIEMDSIHALIESECRRKTILTPMDYFEHINSIRSRGQPPFTMHYVKHDFFHSHNSEYYGSMVVGEATPRCLLYEPKEEIRYKLSFNEKWRSLPNKLNKSIIKPLSRLYEEKPGIPVAKRKALSELQIYMPQDVHDFYTNLLS
jgi:hypothetical protein